MSKSCKLNLQIRSASFKENGHVGTYTQNNSSMSIQLLKSRWKSESDGHSSPNHNVKLGNETGKADGETKATVSNIGVGKDDVDQIPIQSEKLLGNKPNANNNDSRSLNDYKKCRTNTVNENGAKSAGTHIRNDRSDSNEKKAVKTEEKHVTDTKSALEMKTGNKMNTAILAGHSSDKMSVISVKQSSRTTVVSENVNASISVAKNISVESITEENVDVDKTDKEMSMNLMQPIPVINDTSLSVKVEGVSIAPCDLTHSPGSEGTMGELIQASPSLQESVNNKPSSNITIGDIRLGLDRLSGSKAGSSEKLSLNGSARIKLPEKRKFSGDDPETVIDELQAYLREKFGEVVDETYTQVGQVETETEDKLNVETEAATCLSFTSEADSDKTSVKSGVTTPTSPSASSVKKSETVIPHPIFFKTSIKKDPGSKLHDALVNELSSVLRKRDDPSTTSKDGDKETIKSGVGKSDISKKRISAKGNKVLGNKALLAHLEDHLSRTLHKNKIFQRQSLRVLGLETIEVNQNNKSDSSGQEFSAPKEFKEGFIPIAPPPPHLGAVPLNIIPKVTEKTPATTENITTTVTTHVDKSVEVHKETLAKSDLKTNVEQKNLNGSVVKRSVKSTVSDIQANGSFKRKKSDIQETKANNLELSKDDELLIYTYEHPSGRTEGVVCSVETEETLGDSGNTRKYITCVNIVAEKTGNQL